MESHAGQSFSPTDTIIDYLFRFQNCQTHITGFVCSIQDGTVQGVDAEMLDHMRSGLDSLLSFQHLDLEVLPFPSTCMTL
jgi:hypothetical protein